MSQIQQLLTAVNNLTERLSQIESNSKRIYELPQNIAPNGLSKFAISRPEGIGETTEYMTLNAILEWVLEEVQNIENSTVLVQMLPPELLSVPRRIKIPTLSDETEVPIVWKILGVQYFENEEQEIEIPDADEDNYRKDLILGTQNGDVIRLPGIESDEGVIEPVQTENTVLLTSITVFGNTVLDEPSDPILGDAYVSKNSQGWVSYLLNSSVLEIAPTLNAQHNIVFQAFTNGHIITGLNITTTAGKIWTGGIIAIRNNSPFPITLKHLGSSGKIRFDFSNTKEDFVLTNDNGVKYFKLGVIPSTGNATAYCINDFVAGETTADQVSYDNTASGLEAETVQEAVDEVQGNVEQEATDRQLAIETAGFVQRTGTAIAFDKWAIYNSYSSPSDGNFSYDLTNAVVGMIQVVYHEDSLIPTFTQAGITVEVDEFDYTVDVVNEIIVTYRQPNMVKITINSL